MKARIMSLLRTSLLFSPWRVVKKTRALPKRLLISLVVVFFTTATLFSPFVLMPEKARAAFVPVNDAAVVTALSGIAGLEATQTTMATNLTLKETILDGIVFGLINILIDKIGNDVVNWINGGFSGGPAFIQDPGNFLIGAADQLSGKLIADLGLESFLCEPFQLPSLQLALNLEFGVGNGRLQREYYCTVQRAAAIQTQAFTSGNFAGGGGWDAWADIAIRNQNVIGGSIAASAMIDKRLAALLGAEENKLDWGSGFLSKVASTTGYIETPGRLVEDTINDTFDSSRRRIEVADEISEIIGALVNLALQSVMTGFTNTAGAQGVSFSYGSNSAGLTFDANNYQSAISTNASLFAPANTNIIIPSNITTPPPNQIYAASASLGPVVGQDASKAINGDKSGQWNQSATVGAPGTRLGQFPPNSWWEANLGQDVALNQIKVYNPTEGGGGDAPYGLLDNFDRVIFLDANRNPIPFLCTMTYTNPQSGAPVVHNSCTFPGNGNPVQNIATKSYDIKLSLPNGTPAGTYPHVRHVRIESSSSHYHFMINEVEFFKRTGPAFAATFNTQAVVGQPFDPKIDLRATDADGNVLAPQNINLLATRAPNATIQPFIFDASGNVGASNPLGNWIFSYEAVDQYGLKSELLERVVTVSQTQTGTVRDTPYFIVSCSQGTAPNCQFTAAPQTINLGNNVSITGLVWDDSITTGLPTSITSGTSLNIYSGIAAVDMDGNQWTGSTVPFIRTSYSYDGTGSGTYVNKSFFDSTLPGEWVIVYTFEDRIQPSVQAIPVIRKITVN